LKAKYSLLKGEGHCTWHKQLAVIFLIVFLILSSSYFVVQVHASEPSLIDIFNYLGFTNVSETNVETFSAGTYNITLYAEFAGYCDENELSYYEAGTSIFNVIFTGPEGGSGYLSPPITKTFTADYLFGLSMLSPGPHRYFTETSKNPDGEQHAKVYKNLDDPNMFLIGFENFYEGGDRDYNDMVFSLECAHDLTVSAGAGGTTEPPPGTYTYPAGTTVEVTAIPDAGYRFDHWILDGSSAGSVNPISFAMDRDLNLEAVFAETHTLIITVTEGGTTDPSPGTYTYETPTNVVVEAIPSAGYLFDHWEFDGEDIGSENPITVYVGSSHALKAFFSPITYQLTITTSSGGTTDPVPGTYSYAVDSSVEVTAIPDTDYVFDHWELDTVDVGSANLYTVLMDEDHTLKAVFTYSPAPPPLSVSISPLSASIPTGGSVTFTSTVGGGTSPYTYQWYLDGDPVSGATSSGWTFTPPSSGIYYVYVEVTDATSNKVQSDTARITVIPVSVGGYSVSLTRPVVKTPLIFYTMLLVIFGVVMSLIRRKRK